jgi:tRNA A-37 threonylcarbamoyl transferase component Bud32
MQEFVEKLKTNGMFNIELGGKCVGDENIKILCDALKVNHIVNRVNLYDNKISPIGAKYISDMLSVNNSLVYLSLWHNDLREEGVSSILSILKGRPLAHFNFHHNDLGDNGVKKIADFLESDKLVYWCEFSRNNLTNISGEAILKSFEKNKSITKFRLVVQVTHPGMVPGTETESHRISNDILLKIDKYVQRNCALRDECHKAAHEGDIDRVKQYLMEGVSIFSLSGKEGDTLFHIAVKKNNLDLLSMLVKMALSLKMDPAFLRNNMEIAYSNSKTVLEVANEMGNQKIISLLNKNPLQNSVESQESSSQLGFSWLGVSSLVNYIPGYSTVTSYMWGSQIPNSNASSSSTSLIQSDGQITISVAIPYSSLTIGKKLGSGGFGDVFKGEYQYSDVAIKCLKVKDLKEGDIDEFKRETTLMAKLNSPHTIRLYGACFESPHYAIVMEYMPKGSLFDVLQSAQPLMWKIRYQIGIDISVGVAYLHSQSIIHADLKSLNVLLDDTFRAKVSDFGLSKLKLSTSAVTLMGPSNGGTTRWMAPELFEEEAKTTKASDVYSYGIVLWELGSRQIPFFKKAPKNEQVPRLLEKGMKEDITKDTPPSMAKLIGRCWDRRIEQRPTMDETVKELKGEFNTFKFT